MYGEVLSAANPAALLSSVRKSLVHPVMADPGSIVPKTSQVGAKMGALAQLKSEQGRVSELRKANHDEQSQLPVKVAELDKEIARLELLRETDEDSWETEETRFIWEMIAWPPVWKKIEDPTVTISSPNTPAKECLLAARHLLVDKREQFEKAGQTETKLARDITALQMELPRWRRLLFFFSGNGRLLNRHRFACFLVIALVLSSALLYLSSDGSTGDPVGSKIDDDSAGSVYGMLRAHCDHVPANGGGAYFDFWTIWVLITAYCAVSALFVSRVLLHDLAQELLDRVAGCICFMCCCKKPTAIQQAGQLFLLCCLNFFLLTCTFTVLRCTLKLQV
jgi:hypothetical protein